MAGTKGAFDDLLAANRRFAESFDGGLDGRAHAGIAVVTCMDTRVDPLRMIGLRTGDAKVLRNPGGRVDREVLAGLVLAVHLLSVERIMVVPHTRCAMVARSEEELRGRIERAAGRYPSGLVFGAIEDQHDVLKADLRRLRAYPLIPPKVAVGGFLYNVDTGILTPVV